ncbi:MAG: Mth938-like domain-containing protein [Paracoccaceae bacterium]
MRMIEIDYEAQPPIDGYGPGGFRVDGKWLEGPLQVTRAGAGPFAGLSEDGFAPLLAQAKDIDVLLLGMGADIAPLDASLRTALEEAGIGYEVMSTPSACRTYNVLLTEDRLVAAALIPIA